MIAQDYLTRGKLAVIEDQLAGAVEAFRNGALADTEAILKAMVGQINDLLGTAHLVKN